MIRVITILFLFIFISFSSCNQNSKKDKNNFIDINSPKQVSKIEVTCVSITANTFQRQIVSNGKIEARQKSDLHFKINDRIASIKVRNGQKVTRGQLLAILENDIVNNQIEKNIIAFKKAKSQFEKIKINYGLGNQDTLLKPQVLQNLKIRSGYLEAENALKNAKFQYNQSFLRTPFFGVVANIEKKKGDFITTSDVFCTIINPNSLEVSFSVLENEFSFVSKGQEIEIQSFANRDQHFKGVIREINPIVDKNGLIKIKAKITSKNTRLLDGMNAKVLINKPVKDVLVIPKQALVLRSNREVVFTVENGLAKWNYIEVVGENNDSYAIKKGLKATDTIIVSGNLNLSNNAKVNATFVNDGFTQKQ
ncbi:MAG: efflux RND transporter periplasmic adaptor subunit [Tenacibaculum sp.]